MKLKNTQRIHASKSSVLQFRNVQNQRLSVKPRGLWYGFGSSWLDWVESEMPSWRDSTKHLFALEIDSSKVCTIDNIDTLETFHELYAVAWKDIDADMIDWSAVAHDYDGVEINPFTRHLSFELWQKFPWYSSWDVSSGCLWNDRALINVRQLR